MYEYSKNIGDINNVDINLRRELEGLKSEFAIDVLYIRNCKFVRCTCFDDTNKTGSPTCPKCFGSGYFASVQKFNAIESSNSGYGGNDKTKVTAVGAIDQKEEVYYFNFAALPKERDFILKTTWKDGYPVDVIAVLEVVNVFEMRGDNGRIETYGVNITQRADLLRRFDQLLHNLPRKAKLVLSKGGKYIWPHKLLK